MEQSEANDLPKRKSLSLFALTSIVVLIILSLLAIKFLSTQTSTHVEFKEESTNSAYLASNELVHASDYNAAHCEGDNGCEAVRKIQARSSSLRRK